VLLSLLINKLNFIIIIIITYLFPYILTYLFTYILIYLLTYSMEQIPSWEAISPSASQKIPRIFWNPKVRYRVYKSPPHVPVLRYSPGPRQFNRFVTRRVIRLGIFSPSQNPKLENHPLSAVRDWLFNIFAATLHTGGRSSIHNLRTRHSMTGTHLSWIIIITLFKQHVHIEFLSVIS